MSDLHDSAGLNNALNSSKTAAIKETLKEALDVTEGLSPEEVAEILTAAIEAVLQEL
jgi:hypothetical protein